MDKDDSLLDEIMLQRIELIARLAADTPCAEQDKDVVIFWIAELAGEWKERRC